MPAATLVRSARSASGLTQVELSARSGVAQSSLSQIESGERVPTWTTTERLLRAAGWTVISIPTRRADTAAVAVEIKQSLADDDTAAAVRHFIQLADDLAAESDDLRFALTLSDPPPTGSAEWDAALAGLVEYRLGQQALPLPRWVRNPGRRLKRPWTFGSGRYDVDVPRDRVPREFLDRGVLIDRETLESV